MVEGTRSREELEEEAEEMNTHDLIFNAEEFRDHMDELIECAWSTGAFVEMEVSGTNLFLRFNTEDGAKSVYQFARPIIGFLAPVTYFVRRSGVSTILRPADRAHGRVDAFKALARQIYQSIANVAVRGAEQA